MESRVGTGEGDPNWVPPDGPQTYVLDGPPRPRNSREGGLSSQGYQFASLCQCGRTVQEPGLEPGPEPEPGLPKSGDPKSGRTPTRPTSTRGLGGSEEEEPRTTDPGRALQVDPTGRPKRGLGPEAEDVSGPAREGDQRVLPRRESSRTSILPPPKATSKLGARWETGKVFLRQRAGVEELEGILPSSDDSKRPETRESRSSDRDRREVDRERSHAVRSTLREISRSGSSALASSG